VIESFFFACNLLKKRHLGVVHFKENTFGSNTKNS
jgi:hypothetical protein